MERRSFTWHGKFTAAVDKIPEDKRMELIMAVIHYGTDGIEPQLEFPYDAIFESFREDIDYSIKCRENGKKGAEARKNKGGEKPPKNPAAKPTEPPLEGGLATIQTNKQTNKEKINKKENLGEEKTGVSTTKPDSPRCSLCGSETKRRPVFGSDKQVYVCLHGHVCDAQGNAKNHGGAQ